MSQYHQEQSYGQPALDPYQQPAKTSALAITSLVCSLICCLPITTVLGVILGLFALMSIGSNPMKKGKGIAIAGIILGIVFTAGQAYFVFTLYTGFAVFKDAPYHAISPGFQGDYAGMRANFGAAGRTATDEQAQAFIEELRSRYGELNGATIDFSQYSNMQQPAPGTTAMTLPWILNFDNGPMDAELTFSGDDQVPGSNSIIFRDITILDASDGDITFPPPTTPAAGVGETLEDVGEAIQDAAESASDGSD